MKLLSIAKYVFTFSIFLFFIYFGGKKERENEHRQKWQEDDQVVFQNKTTCKLCRI